MTTSVDEYLLVEPDWNSSVYFRKRWQTGIQKSLKNNEKRSALLSWPRRSLQYTIVTVDYEETINVKNRLSKNLHNVWGIPFWQDRTALTSEAASGQAVLEIESAQYRNFEEGGSMYNNVFERFV